MQRPRLERYPLYSTLRKFYDSVLKPRLPNKIGVYNGVAVRDRGLFDITDENPEYEGPLVSSLRKRIRTGDRVVVVGGGKGVSIVVSANQVGADGGVTVYEGSHEGADRVWKTLRLNQIDHRTTVEHAVVGSAIDVYGDLEGAARVHPTDLPECDVLELDCEGAELEILQQLDISPRTIIVETHAHLDAPEADVREKLNGLSYDVVERGVEMAEKGVIVLTARSRDVS